MTGALEQLAVNIGTKLTEREWKLITAESCTGGGLSYHLTSIPGSSTWFERGLVVYSNIAKEQLLGVKPLTIEVFGSVSEQTVIEMAEGALRHSQAQMSIAITGIAGPTGGTADKPVGTVWFAWSGINIQTKTMVDILSGNRQAVREQAIHIAMEKLLELLH